MTKPDDTIRVLIPLKVRKKNGRPKILPPADYLPSEDQTQDPHFLRAIGRAWGWRRRMEAGEFATIQELAEAVGLAERHVSRQLRLAYLAPEVLEALVVAVMDGLAVLMVFLVRQILAVVAVVVALMALQEVAVVLAL